MMQEYDRVCAVCGTDKAVKCYTMSSGAETAIAMLCPSDGKPIDDLIKVGHTDSRRYKASPRDDTAKGLIIPIEDL